MKQNKLCPSTKQAYIRQCLTGVRYTTLIKYIFLFHTLTLLSEKQPQAQEMEILHPPCLDTSSSQDILPPSQLLNLLIEGLFPAEFGGKRSSFLPLSPFFPLEHFAKLESTNPDIAPKPNLDIFNGSDAS